MEAWAGAGAGRRRRSRSAASARASATECRCARRSTARDSASRFAWASRLAVSLIGRHLGAGRAVPARVIATAVARRSGGRIRPVCNYEAAAGDGSVAHGRRPSDSRVGHAPARPSPHANPRSPRRLGILENGRSSHPAAFPRVCVGGYGPLGGSDEDSVGQSHVGVGPRGGSRLRCWRAGSADRRHHRHHHVERRPVACRARRSRSNRPAIQGTKTAVTDVNGIYVVRRLPPGRACRHRRDGRHGDASSGRPASSSGRIVTLDVKMAPVGGGRAGHRPRQRRPRRDEPDHRRQLQRQADQRPADRPHAPFTIAELAPGLTDNGPNAGQITHRRRVRLRQRLPDQRRRRQRQPLRHATEPLHRGRDRGDAGADVGHLGRIRALLRRRRQRRHQERRRHLLRAASARTCATRPGPTRRRSRRASARAPATRTRLEARSAGRSSATGSGSSAPAATRTRPKAATFAQTGIGYDSGLRQQALRAEGHLHAARRTTTLQVGYTDNRTEQTNRRRPRRLASTRATLVTRVAAQRSVRAPTGTACCSPKLFATARSRRSASGFRNTGGTSTDDRRLAVPHPRPQRHPGQPALQRAVLRLDRSRGPRQPPVGGQPLDAAVVGQGRQPRPQGRLRVVPVDRHRRQLADVDRLRVLRRLRDQRAAMPVFDAARPADPDVRARDVAPLATGCATRGASIDIKTTSLYAHDRWAANRALTVDAGLRFERVRSDATGDIIGADTEHRGAAPGRDLRRQG